MADQEVILKQASIIEKDAECINMLSDLLRETLTLLAQYQTVDAEERRFNEITKLQADRRA